MKPITIDLSHMTNGGFAHCTTDSATVGDSKTVISFRNTAVTFVVHGGLG